MKVFFAVPAYRGIRCLPMLDSLEGTCLALKAKGHDAMLCTLMGSPYIQVARNELVRQFLLSDADTMFFLDDDLEWNPENAVRVLEADGDFVAGVYPLKHDKVSFPCSIYTDRDGIPLIRRADGCLKASMVPGGFIRLKRNVLEKMVSAYSDRFYDDTFDENEPKSVCDLFPAGLQNGQWVGEDVAFCRLWLRIGGEIWLQPNITFTHHGPQGSVTGPWTGNYHEYLMALPGGRNFKG